MNYKWGRMSLLIVVLTTSQWNLGIAQRDRGGFLLGLNSMVSYSDARCDGCLGEESAFGIGLGAVIGSQVGDRFLIAIEPSYSYENLSGHLSRKTLRFGGNAYYYLGSARKWFVSAGAGASKISVTESGVTDRGWGPAVRIGGGFDLSHSPTTATLGAYFTNAWIGQSHRTIDGGILQGGSPQFGFSSLHSSSLALEFGVRFY